MCNTVVYGGGTFIESKCHLATAAPSFGTTARTLHNLLSRDSYFRSELVLTKMADYNSHIETNTDLYYHVMDTIKNKGVECVIFNAAVCDFYLQGLPNIPRLTSDKNYQATLAPYSGKFINLLKNNRPDMFVVGFKTSFGSKESEQIELASRQIDNSGVDIVFCNDLASRNNVIVVKTGGVHRGSREQLLQLLVTLIKQGTKSGNHFEAFKCYQ